MCYFTLDGENSSRGTFTEKESLPWGTDVNATELVYIHRGV